MSINYAHLADVALTLIRDNGRDVTFRRVSRLAADVSKPWRAVDSSTVATDGQSTVVVRAVVVPYQQIETDGEMVRRGDKRCYVSAEAWIAACAALDVPGVVVNRQLEFYDTMIESDGQTWRVLNVGLVNPGPLAIPILYDVHMRL